MNSTDYRAAIAALNLSQRAAARVIGVNERTSRTYAAHGVPEKHSAWVRDKLADHAASQQGENLCKTVQNTPTTA